jgi:type II secretory pathway component PulL
VALLAPQQQQKRRRQQRRQWQVARVVLVPVLVLVLVLVLVEKGHHPTAKPLAQQPSRGSSS